MKKETAYILATCKKDWADEFDTFGILVCTKECWEAMVEKVENFDYPKTESFGTNEEHEYLDAKNYLSDITVKEISEKEAFRFKDLLVSYGGKRDGNVHFEIGTFPWFAE